MGGYFDVRQLAVGGFDLNFSYLITGGGEAALVDPTGDLTVIREAVQAAGAVRATYILLTHSHPDHVENVSAVRDFFPAPILAHPASRFSGSFPLLDGQILPLGEGGGIEVLFTPGHSPDSVCYRLSDNSGIFTGDTLFIGCCGFCEAGPMFDSLRRLKTLSDGHVIYSGHDYGNTPTATMGEEKQSNPYLRCRSLTEFRQALEHLE